MGEYLSSNKVAEILWPHFTAWFVLIRHAKMDKAKLDAHKDILILLDTIVPPTEAEISPLLGGLAKREHASKIASMADKIADGDPKLQMDDITVLVDKYNHAVGKIDVVEKHILTPTLDAMAAVTAKGLSWRLEPLNQSLGDLRLGDFVVFAARPDVGKTTFLASESTYMAGQLSADKQVLWVNNEEEGNKVFRRIVQAALGMPSIKLEADLPAALKAYETKMGRLDKIIMLNKADVHVKEVDRLIAKYNIGLIIFDQLWKVHGFDVEASNEVTRQTMLFGWARELAKSVAPVITVTQADGSAEGTKWIDMSQIYGSKTGIQGEADAIITLGRLPEPPYDTRYLYIPKNKMTGGTDPTKRNGRYEITILPDIVRFTDV